MVEPPPAAPAEEPSALDLAPAVEPLRIARDDAARELVLSWEELGVDSAYAVYRGEIGAFYTHGDIGACDLSAPAVRLPLEPGDQYFIAVGVNCAGEESSTGRDSAGAERPSAADAGGACP